MGTNAAGAGSATLTFSLALALALSPGILSSAMPLGSASAVGDAADASVSLREVSTSTDRLGESGPCVLGSSPCPVPCREERANKCVAAV